MRGFPRLTMSQESPGTSGRWRRSLWRYPSAMAAMAALLLAAGNATAGGRWLVAEPVQGEKIRVDGDLREWPAKLTILGETREGAALEARTVVGYDDANLYLALRVSDKRVARTAAAKQSEDHATLTIAFPRGHGNYSTYEVDVFPGDPGKLPALVKLGGKSVAGAKAVENPVEKELLLEAQIPWATFPEAARTRVGLRASVSYTNADSPGSIKSVISTASGKSGRALGPLLLEAEQGLADLVRDNGLPDAPAREVYGNLSGDGMFERVAVFGPFLTISGPRFRGGKEFYFAKLGVSGPEQVKGLELADFDGDGQKEIVVRKRFGSNDKYREVLEVMKIGHDDAPFVTFSHEIGIKTQDGSISNKVKIEDSAIEIAQGDSDGFEPDSYNEPLPGGNTLSALLPWESAKSRTFKWQGNAFVKASEETQSPKSKGSGKKAAAARAKSTEEGPRQPPPPRPPTSDELLDRVYALYKKDRGVGGGHPRFDFVTDVAGDGAPERVVIHDKDMVVFGKGFRSGTSYAFISVGVSDPKDILDATARDLTGDGKAEIIVRAVMRAKASKELGGDTVERHALLVYGIRDDKLQRLFGAETGRTLGKNQIIGSVSFERGARIELRAGRAIGWTEGNYPFPADTTTAGGLEPLILPWNGGKRSYKFNGSAFAAE
jgi:hypothetical protein